MPTDRTSFLASDPTRLKIAEWCRAEALTREQIAKRLGRQSGSMSAPKTMLQQGALVDAGHTGTGRHAARLFRLSPDWHHALDAALEMRAPARLEPGADLLLISLAETEDACRALAKEQTIEWAMQLEGEQMGLMLSPRRDSDSRATIRATAALARAGVRPLRVRLRTPMNARELKDWASRVAAAGEPPSLPSGGG